MKRLFLPLFLLSCISCKYDYIHLDEEPPTSFTQKVIVELFNGAWCNWSPDGDLMVKEVKEYVDDNRYDYIQYHLSDQMDIPDDDDIDNHYNGFGYPSGMTNRLGGESHNRYVGLNQYPGYDPEKHNAFLVETMAILEEEADCGLAIDASEIKNNSLNLKIKLAFIPTGLKQNHEDSKFYLNVVVYEKEMSGQGVGWDYHNVYSKYSHAAYGSDHPHYYDPDPIVGYIHTNPSRVVLTDVPFGSLIDSMSLRSNSVLDFSFQLPLEGHGDDLRIAAFVYEYLGDPFHEVSIVHNVQFVDLGQNQSFD